MNRFLQSFFGFFGYSGKQEVIDTSVQKDSEIGTRADSENALRYLYDQMFVDSRLRAAIQDIRAMDKKDTRVKKIHKRMARDVTKGGVKLVWNGAENKRITRLWKEYEKRVGLDNRSKLFSDARGFVMEGNLSLQWVINESKQVTAGIRMPTETLIPQVSANGQFENVQQAYKQVNPLTQQTLCTFALWQLSVTRLDPDNFDDKGSLGRPYLDAAREVWRKLTMTEQDLVIRRRTRAPQKLAHSLKGASKEELLSYQMQTEGKAGQITTDFYANDLSVTAISGDANLDQIADIYYLLDTFFAGAPAPKGLFGYVGDTPRDVLDDLKGDYYEEIDLLQDLLAQAYRQGFELQLLLAGLNPQVYDFTVAMAERQTETRNQKADLALKAQALGVPEQIVSEVAGFDHTRVKAIREQEAKEKKAYPDDDYPGDEPRAGGKVSITPGNARKGESATAIGNH